jgi:hypothetical protein
MANNRIDKLLSGRNKRDFAREYEIPEQTLYKICKKPTMKNISIDVFLKIAHGLGMTAEELYYGDKRPDKEAHAYADPRQQEINDTFETVTEDGKQAMWTNAVMARTTFPDGVERGDVQEEIAE